MKHTLAILKPNIIEANQIGEVLRLISFWGFTIEDAKYIPSADINFVKEFYSEHKGKDFYDRLVNGMANRPWFAIKLGYKHSTDVVEQWRKWLGKIRGEYSGDELHDNGFHGSDSLESAKRELELIFGSKESKYFSFYNKEDRSYNKIKIEEVSSLKIVGVKSYITLRDGTKYGLNHDIGRRLNKILK